VCFGGNATPNILLFTRNAESLPVLAQQTEILQIGMIILSTLLSPID